jgi:hypothetical protein
MKPHIKNLVPLAGVMTVTMLMLGCSSGAQMPSMGVAQSQGHAVLTQSIDRAAQAASPSDNGGCQNSDGVDVTPCRVVFNANHPGPTNVKVQSHGRRITEKDNCATKGVATVTLLGNRTFSVTAGVTAGSCTAHFVRKNNNNDDGGQGAVLTVINRL